MCVRVAESQDSSLNENQEEKRKKVQSTFQPSLDQFKDPRTGWFKRKHSAVDFQPVQCRIKTPKPVA